MVWTKLVTVCSVQSNAEHTLRPKIGNNGADRAQVQKRVKKKNANFLNIAEIEWLSMKFNWCCDQIMMKWICMNAWCRYSIANEEVRVRHPMTGRHRPSWNSNAILAWRKHHHRHFQFIPHLVVLSQTYEKLHGANVCARMPSNWMDRVHAFDLRFVDWYRWLTDSSSMHESELIWPSFLTLWIIVRVSKIQGRTGWNLFLIILVQSAPNV